MPDTTPTLYEHIYFLKLYRCTQNCVGKNSSRYTVYKVCHIGCGVTTGIGAVLFTAKAEAGSNVVVFGLGGIGLNVIQGAKMVGADKVIVIDINPNSEAMARDFGMTHFINPNEVDDIVDAIIQLTDGVADYSFECIGNTQIMRQALECTHRGWGTAICC